MDDIADASTDSSKRPAEIETQVRQPDQARLESFQQIHSIAGGPPSQIGRFQITDVLGQGAFGIVYRALDPQLDRQVAIKIPHVGSLDSNESRERFLREARAAATLRHPNICPVYEVGESNGRPYIVMAYISGHTLAKVSSSGSRRHTDRQAALVVRKLAQALAAAHAKKVVHRDLKPANVMIDKESREPVIMDFGLARYERAEDSNLTQSGQIMGTPAYMPPEQARGATETIGPASDVYSLGVIFYELLCGERPFDGSVAEVFAKILGGKPRPPSSRRPDVDPTLEAICLKAMAHSIADRYESMNEFAGELSDYLKQSIGGAAAMSTARLDGSTLPPPVIPTAELVEESSAATSTATRTPPSRRWLVGAAAVAASTSILGIVLFTLPEREVVTKSQTGQGNTRTVDPTDSIEFRSLFSGGDLANWTQLPLDHWIAEGETIRCIASETGGASKTSYILAPADPPSPFPGIYRDFVLKLKVKVPEGRRANVVVRAKTSPELEFVAIPILAKADYQSLSIAEKRDLMRTHEMRTEVFFDFVARAAKPAGEWNDLTIRCKQDELDVTLNGTSLDHKVRGKIKRVGFFQNAPRSGYVGFANFDGSSQNVCFKEIQIGELPTEPEP